MAKGVPRVTVGALTNGFKVHLKHVVANLCFPALDLLDIVDNSSLISSDCKEKVPTHHFILLQTLVLHLIKLLPLETHFPLTCFLITLLSVLQLKELLNYYYPIEIDSSRPVEEKIPLMVEW